MTQTRSSPEKSGRFTARHRGDWIQNRERLEYVVDIFALKESLEVNDRFKAAILAELGADVDLKRAARRYVECLSAVHEFAREGMAPTLDAARTNIAGCIAAYLAAGASSTLGLAAIHIDEQVGHEISYTHLFLEWDDVRRALLIKNRQLVNLSKRHATGR